MTRHLILMLTVTCLTRLALTQEIPLAPSAKPQRTLTWRGEVTAPAPPPAAVRISPHPRPGHDKMEALAKLWRDSESREDRQRVEQIVADMLDEQFDADLEQREEELRKIEERVARLQEQLARRLQSKEEIIRLQLKQMTMAWDGLGWEHEQTRSGRRRLAVGALANPSASFIVGPHRADPLTILVFDAIEQEEEDKLEFLTQKLMDNMSDWEPQQVNHTLWKVFEAAQDEIDRHPFWEALVAAGEQALDRAGEGPQAANLWDTVAHLYEQLGDIDKAIECQHQAVKLGSRGGFGTDPAKLKQYLQELEAAR